jgi:endonuclease/exonuclease/phosphatase family metal-dependent hydrolase
MQRFFLFLTCIFLLQNLNGQSSIDSLTYVHYNIMMYANGDCGSLATRNSRLQPVLAYLQPDILTINEMSNNSAAVNNFHQNALNFAPQMEKTTFSNTAGSNIINVLFYNSAKLGLLGSTAITGPIRDIDVHHLYHKGATQVGDTLDFYCFVAHLKSSPGSSNEMQRAEAAALVADWLGQHPEVTRYMFSGDFNLYSSNEPAWQTLVTQSNLFYDPAGQPEGWVGPSFAAIHTQSPAPSSVPCAVTGGIDDRFDFILTSSEIQAGQGLLRYVADSYRAVGNDGLSYDNSLQCPLNTSVPPTVCEALRNASDHLPVAMKLAVTLPSSSTEILVQDVPFSLVGNVVRDVLTVKNSGADGKKWHWQVLNLLGEIMLEGESNQAQQIIPIHSLSTGSYVLRVGDGAGQTAVFRWVKI